MTNIEPYFLPLTEWSDDRRTCREYLVCPLCHQRFADSGDGELGAQLAVHLDGHTVVEALQLLRRLTIEHIRVIQMLTRDLYTLKHSL